MDALEKVIAHLLAESGKPVHEHVDMTGEDILAALAKLDAEDVCLRKYAQRITGDASKVPWFALWRWRIGS